jgi:D-alanine-D-alanine ligase
MAVYDEAIVLCNRMAVGSPEDILDVKVQAEWICEELEAAGYRARMMPFGLDAVNQLEEARLRGGCFVINMVDSAPGEETFVYLAPSLMEAVGIPFAGCGAEALLVTTNKLLTKRLLASYGLPTPGWFEGDDEFQPGRYLIKAVCEDASIGLDDHSLVDVETPEALHALTEQRVQQDGKRYFAEKFIDGREFNVCVYGNREHPAVLPPYEWVFPGFREAGKPNFINYNAKWIENTFEYDQLAAVYHLPPEDTPLVQELVRLTEACWRKFELNGWARVDFRIDADGKPWILEINCNPSFYGFFNIARAHGFLFSQVIKGVAGALIQKGYSI